MIAIREHNRDAARATVPITRTLRYTTCRRQVPKVRDRSGSGVKVNSSIVPPSEEVPKPAHQPMEQLRDRAIQLRNCRCSIYVEITRRHDRRKLI
jgi:hypothetical protein